MANASINRVVGHLKRVTGQPELGRAADRDLLRRFAESNDEAAFAELVRRHGPLVLGTCQRVLRHRQDAEDAFQAVFLVLARKAGSVTWGESISYWLHEVAMRTAMKARTSQAKRRNRERAEVAEPAAPEPPPESQVADILDEEIRRLPRQYGSAVVLCCLQETSLAEAAKRLGVSEGSVRARLWRGREILRKRLASRGVTLPTAAAGSLALLPNPLPAAVPLVPTGVVTAFAGGAVPISNSTILAQGVLQAMFVQKMKLIALVTLSLFVTAGGVGVWLQRAEANRPHDDPPRLSKLDPRDIPVPKVEKKFVRKAEEGDEKFKRVLLEVEFRSVDPTKRTVVVEGEIDDQKREITFVVAPDAEIVVARQKLTLKEIQPKMIGSIWILEQNRETVVELLAKWPTYKAKLAGADGGKSAITVKLEAKNGLEVDQTYPVNSEAKVFIDGMTSSLSDLSAGQEVEFEFSVDKKSLVRLEAESSADELHARFKSFDSAKGLLMVTVEVSGRRTERKVDLAFDVTKDAAIRHEGKDTTLTDLKPGMPVRMRLKADRKTVTNVWAVDAGKEDNDD